MSGHRARARRRQIERERAARAARGGRTRHEDGLDLQDGPTRQWSPAQLALAAAVGNAIAERFILRSDDSPEGFSLDYDWSRPPGKPQDARRPSRLAQLGQALRDAWPPWEAALGGGLIVAGSALAWGFRGALVAAGAVVVLWVGAALAALSCYQKD